MNTKKKQKKKEEEEEEGFIDIFIIMNTTYQFKRGHRLCWHESWEEKKGGNVHYGLCGFCNTKYTFGFSLSAPEFFFFFEAHFFGSGHCSMGPVHYLRDPKISFFNKTFTKNGPYSTIHTFKNYFVIVFLVFNKISGIQTHPKGLKKKKLDKWAVNDAFG